MADCENSIHKYFDGKKTVDEILYKAEISRKQLREVLHQFSDHASPLFGDSYLGY